MLEQRLVRTCGGMVKLIDGDHIKVPRVERTESDRIQALNRGEHVLEALRTMLADPQLAEARIPKGMSKRPATLLQDLLTVRHEEQTRSCQNRSQADEIHRRHHRLASP